MAGKGLNYLKLSQVLFPFFSANIKLLQEKYANSCTAAKLNAH